MQCRLGCEIYKGIVCETEPQLDWISEIYKDNFVAKFLDTAPWTYFG